MKLQRNIPFIVLLFQIYILQPWLTCIKIAESFEFSSLDALLKTNNQIQNDKGMPPEVARFFHNKISINGAEIANRYFHFWNPNFGALYFSIVGYFGILYGFYFLVTRKSTSRKAIGTLIVLLVLPLLEVFSISINFKIKLILLSLPYYLFSAYGIWQFLKLHRKFGSFIIISLIVLSIWYFLVFQNDIFSHFCYNR